MACAGVTVQPGDLVVGDDDGVVVLPPGLAPEILADAREQERQEEFVTTQVASGAELDGLYPLGDRWRAAYEAWLSGQEQADRAGRAGAMRFRADPSSLRGSIAPVVTPFTADGQLDTEGLRRLIGWQLDCGSHGISIGGSTGEPSAQTPQERIAAMTEAASVIADRVPFLPGTGSARLDETLELTAAAAGLRRGCRAGDHAVLRAADAGGPVPLVRDRGRRVPGPADRRLQRPEPHRRRHRAGDRRPAAATFDNFVGVKETTRDFEHFSRVLHLCGRDLLVWSGIELLCLPLLALGGVGFVSATANMAPAAVAQMFELWKAGEHEKARELHYGLHPLVDVLFTETNPAPAKWVLQQAGLLGSAHVRPPLIALDARPGSAGSPSCCAAGATCR